MRRLPRYLFTLCSALSLLLCVATCVLWVRSYWVAELLTHRTAGRNGAAFTERTLVLAPGVVEFGQFSSPATLPRTAPLGLTREQVAASRVRLPRGTVAQRLGFGFTRLGTAGWSLSVPCWLIAVAFAAPPASWLYVATHRRRRIRAGHCLACGYDLRASPGRCPECGALAIETGENRGASP